jgi:hypothetical protein
MTRRERLEAKADRRRDWAAGRLQKAAGLDRQNAPYRGDIAFNTQPGHIPERARVIRRTDQAFAHRDMAAHHEAKADGLERQLDRSIYSDDADAIPALEARIAELERERARMVAVNKAYRKGDRVALDCLGLDLERLRATLSEPGTWYKVPHPAYELSNLGGRIGAAKKRIETIRWQATQQEIAEAAPSGVVLTEHPGSDYCSVRFAAKPDRAILDALRAAGFWWSSGAWAGLRSALPASVATLLGSGEDWGCDVKRHPCYCNPESAGGVSHHTEYPHAWCPRCEENTPPPPDELAEDARGVHAATCYQRSHGANECSCHVAQMIEDA